MPLTNESFVIGVTFGPLKFYRRITAKFSR